MPRRYEAGLHRTDIKLDLTAELRKRYRSRHGSVPPLTVTLAIRLSLFPPVIVKPPEPMVRL